MQQSLAKPRIPHWIRHQVPGPEATSKIHLALLPTKPLDQNAIHISKSIKANKHAAAGQLAGDRDKHLHLAAVKVAGDQEKRLATGKAAGDQTCLKKQLITTKRDRPPSSV